MTLELLDPRDEKSNAPVHRNDSGQRSEQWQQYASDPARARRRQELCIELRETLRERLPEYMIPAQILALESLPLTANGKLDRAALPEPDVGGNGQFMAPQGVIESQLARLWSEVLGVERVGRADNFFELGGHSLAASALIARVRQAWPDRAVASMPLRTVFSHPTLQAFAERVTELLQDVATAPLPALVAVPRASAMSLSPAQLRLWMVDRLLERSEDRAAYNMAARLRITGALSLPILRASLVQLVARHEILRTGYGEGADGEPVAVIAPQVPFDIPLLDLSHLERESRELQVAQLAREHAQQTFALEQAPLLRVQVVRETRDEHLLLVALHHIVADGWSVAVLIDELAAIYRALRDGVQPALRPLPVQYVDYAEWQHRLWDAERTLCETEFWQKYLRGAPAVPALDGDRARPAVASHAGELVRLTIPAALRARLSEVGKAHDATLFVTLLATFQALIHRASGRDDVLIGTDVAGRPHADLEGLVGFFVNVLPLRSRLRSEMSFKDLLLATRDNTLEAFEHQALPFDKVVEAAGVERDRRWNPLVQMLFVLQNAPRGRFDVPGLAIEMLPPLEVQSKFDLAVFVSEQTESLAVEWVYASALFTRQTIEDLTASWLQLMEHVVAQPTAALAEVPVTKRSSAARNNKLDKLKKIASRPPADRAPVAPVRTSLLNGGHLMPLVVEPSAPDLDPWRWAAAHRDFVERSLCSHAAVLFRGFTLTTPQDFEAFAEALEPTLHGSYGDLPKKEGARNLYRSTPYPNEQMILFHNESSHLATWPRKQLFFCEHPGDSGGATPIVDGREMIRRLPRAIVETFERKALLYVRTFTARLDVSWQSFFKTDSRAEVEAQLRATHIAWQWLEDDALQTRARCPAVITHPRTGERVFFNQLQLHHVACLDAQVREDLLSMVPMDRLPRHVYYGDGSPIDDETMAIVSRTYAECAVRFPWRRGDVLMLDNMLAAHARDPYQGPRKIVVAMGAMFERASLLVPAAATDEVLA
jgi:alpha-ketoglutarate-dependent taurine dioxygenase